MTTDLIGVDTETGGIYPSINPLLSIAVVTSWDVESLILYVLPEPGKTIHPEAAMINGYTPELWAERGAVRLHTAQLMLAAHLEFLFREKKEARLVAHNAGFDRSFLEEAARPFDIQLPGRYAWRCSMMLMGELMDAGQLPPGSLSLARLGELADLWPVGGRSELHDVAEDARAALAGYQWLQKKKEGCAA